MKLQMFIEAIKEEEVLCNKIIGEIPYDVIMMNNDLRKNQKGLVRNTHIKFITRYLVKHIISYLVILF